MRWNLLILSFHRRVVSIALGVRIRLFASRLNATCVNKSTERIDDARSLVVFRLFSLSWKIVFVYWQASYLFRFRSFFFLSNFHFRYLSFCLSLLVFRLYFYQHYFVLSLLSLSMFITENVVPFWHWAHTQKKTHSPTGEKTVRRIKLEMLNWSNAQWEMFLFRHRINFEPNKINECVIDEHGIALARPHSLTGGNVWAQWKSKWLSRLEKNTIIYWHMYITIFTLKTIVVRSLPCLVICLGRQLQQHNRRETSKRTTIIELMRSLSRL